MEDIKETAEDRIRDRRNRKMMEDLPVLGRVVIEPEGIDLNLYKKIGEEVTRVVEHKPGQLYIKEIVRPKYGLKDNTALPPSGKKSVEIAACPCFQSTKEYPGRRCWQRFSCRSMNITFRSTVRFNSFGT